MTAHPFDWATSGRRCNGEQDGTIPRVDEVASAGVRLSLSEPALGVLAGVEGPVLDTRNALDSVPLPLPPNGSTLSLAGHLVRPLFEPTILDVARREGLLPVRMRRSGCLTVLGTLLRDRSYPAVAVGIDVGLESMLFVRVVGRGFAHAVALGEGPVEQDVLRFMLTSRPGPGRPGGRSPRWCGSVGGLTGIPKPAAI